MNIIPKNITFSRRIISQTTTSFWYNTRVASKRNEDSSQQLHYIRSLTDSNTFNWNEIKNNALSKYGNLNQTNIDAVILKVMVNDRKFSAAQSFVTYLKGTEVDLPLGVINGLLHYYTEYAKVNTLSKDEKEYILKLYSHLYNKYKVLESTTCERLLQALCSIDEWQKCIKVLDDIYLSNSPSHAAFSSLIATLFRNNKKAEALKFIDKSLSNRRPLLNSAYNEWINYILRNHKDKKTKVKHLNDICMYLHNNCVVISEETAEILKNTYSLLDWNASFTNIIRQSGVCQNCDDTLHCFKLSDNEFSELSKNVQDKLIIGKDLFLKTSPEELKTFLDFINDTKPYDIVLDALNIGYSRGLVGIKDRINAIFYVVNYFARQNKKILVLGRKHMLKWGKNFSQNLSNRAFTFFTDDISQDDPYFLTAAILSGPQTDILTKDLLRNHQFVLKEDHLRKLFQRWQWQHQWMMFMPKGTFNLQAPLNFTPIAQRTNKGWHLPYEVNNGTLGKFNSGLPDSFRWMCLSPKT